jgi:hypothetical protein
VVTDCNFFNNDSENYIGNNPYIYTNNAQINITNSTFQNNSGYAIFSYTSIVYISSSIFQQISQSIFTQSSNIIIVSSIFLNNTNTILLNASNTTGILTNITMKSNSCYGNFNIYQSNIIIQQSNLQYNNNTTNELCYIPISFLHIYEFSNNTTFCEKECYVPSPTTTPTRAPNGTGVFFVFKKCMIYVLLIIYRSM